MLAIIFFLHNFNIYMLSTNNFLSFPLLFRTTLAILKAKVILLIIICIEEEGFPDESSPHLYRREDTASLLTLQSYVNGHVRKP